MALLGYTSELFEMTASETALLTANISVDKTVLRDAWLKQVSDTLTQATLELPKDEWQINGGRAGIHTEHLGQVLSELQYLQRAYPGLSW